MFYAEAAAAEIRRKNRELYDETSGPVWQYAVYGAVHGGWEFINLGGRRVLDEVARRASLGPGREALELCSGQGATCRYLAEFYGCAVTGVELNPVQADRARARLSVCDPRVAARVRLVEGDAMEWREPGRYDAVFSLDSMMLIPHPARVFDNAYVSLRPGGVVALAAIVAGPRADDQLRRFVWESDGMITLLPPEGYRDMLVAAGFEGVESEDYTGLATDASVMMGAALARLRDEVGSAEDGDDYNEWLGVNEVYLSGFRGGKLGYHLITGRRP